MKVHRYSEHQRRLWVHEMMHKTKTVKAICNEASISRATLYNWISEFNEIGAKTNEEPSPATASLSWQPTDKYKILLSALLKIDGDKTISCKLVREMVKRYNITPAQACELVNLPEEAYRHRPRKPEADDKEVYAALVHLLDENKSRTLEDCIAILQQQQPHWAVKQVKRIYRQDRLYLQRTRLRQVAFLPETKTVATGILLPKRLQREAAFWHLGLIKEENCWLLFLLDYEEGTPLNAIAGNGEPSEAAVMQLLTKAAEENGLPKKIRLPNVTPFASRELSKWSWENKVALYNLSMAKAENNLEAEYIKDDIKKQLMIEETTTAESLQTRSEEWILNFAQQAKGAINYFVKEEII
ncbi:MAG: transposase [Bacteroidota bacterium]|nr:transposase [Bacteroidota bacterium]